MTTISTLQYLYPVLAYLLGSVPFGLILSKLFGNGKLRESGSKNIGATNVMRTQGKVLGFLTFFLDFAKGAIAIYFFQPDHELVRLVVIAAPVAGHMFPVWLNFKGGKGIATYFGILCALNMYVFFATALVWSFVFAISKTSSIAGLTSVILSSVIFFFAEHKCNLVFFNQLCVLIVLIVVIIVKHHDNIKRLIKKNELKM